MKRVVLFLILCLLLTLVGCKKEIVTVKKPVSQKAKQADVKKEEQQQSAKKGEVAKAKVYVYDPQGRRDPFLSLVETGKRRPEKKIGATPIESFSIEEFVLMAIAADKEKAYALIMLPDQKTFTITEGMKIGLEGGVVKEITEDKVVIREYVKDFRGNIKPKDTVLKLHKGEE